MNIFSLGDQEFFPDDQGSEEGGIGPWAGETRPRTLACHRESWETHF